MLLWKYTRKENNKILLPVRCFWHLVQLHTQLESPLMFCDLQYSVSSLIVHLPYSPYSLIVQLPSVTHLYIRL